MKKCSQDKARNDVGIWRNCLARNKPRGSTKCFDAMKSVTIQAMAALQGPERSKRAKSSGRSARPRSAIPE